MTRWRLCSILLTVVALAGALGTFYGLHDSIPAQVPTHWDINGHPDAWTTRDNLLPHFLAFPGVMAIMTLLMWILPWLSPRRFDVDRFRSTFEYIFTLIIGLMGYLGAVLMWGSLHPNLVLIRFVIVGIFVMFALMSNVIGQARRNFWMGVRTPWTLASEVVWNRTHRLAAWIWTPCSLLGAIAVLAGVPLLWCFVFLMIYLLVPVPYSLYLYKRLEKEGKLDVSE